MLLNSLSQWAFLKFDVDRVGELIESIAANTSYWYSARDSKKVVPGHYKVNAMDGLEAKIEAMFKSFSTKIDTKLDEHIKQRSCMTEPDHCLALASNFNTWGTLRGA